MRKRLETLRTNRGQRGFTLVELLIVIAIIAIMIAIALPAISNFLKNYKIKGAAQQVAAEIQVARTKAIMKNVNWGAVFYVESATTYRIFYEDAPGQVTPQAYSAVTAEPLRTLPEGLLFAPGAGYGLRFSRLGAMCDLPAGAGCTRLPTGMPTTYNAFTITGGTASISVTQPLTGLTKNVSVMPGGRVVAQP